MPVNPNRQRQEGFGIVVVALLFTAFATIAAFMLDSSSVQLEQERQNRAQAQLTRLNVAMARFARNTDHRLPCPSSMQVVPTDPTFGATTSNCSTVTPSGVDLSGQLLFGMVPVQALIPYGISYDDAFDPWGSRVLYVVNRNLTTGTIGTVTDAQRPYVTDYITGALITPGPDAVLVSFGRDRMGGTLRGQTSLASPATACGTGRRGENCNEDQNFLRGPIFTGSRTATGLYFDDTVSTLRYTN